MSERGCSLDLPVFLTILRDGVRLFGRDLEEFVVLADAARASVENIIIDHVEKH